MNRNGRGNSSALDWIGTAACYSLMVAALWSVANFSVESVATWFVHPLLANGAVLPQHLEGASWLRMGLISLALTAGLMPLLLRAPPLGDAQLASVTTPSLDQPSRTFILFSILAIVAGVALRIQRIDESLWYDEIASLRAHVVHGPGAIVGNYFVSSNHVAQSLATWYAVATTGLVNEVIVRAPSLIAGLCTVLAMGGLGRFVGGRTLGWSAAATTALMPVAVLESVEARGYAMAALFSTLALLCAAWGVRHRVQGHTGRLAAILAGLALALAAWSHLVAGCMIIAFFIASATFTLCRSLPHSRAWSRILSVSSLFGAIVLFTLVAPLIPDFIRTKSEFFSLDGDEPSLLGPEGIRVGLQLGGSWIWWSALPGIMLAVAGIASIWRTRERWAYCAPILSIALLALVIMLVAIATSGSWVYARFGLFAMPLSVIAIAASVDPHSRYRSILIPSVAAVGLLWSFSLLSMTPKQPLREAVVHVSEMAHPLDRVAGIGLRDDVLSYYGNAVDLDIVHTGTRGERLEEVLDRDQPQWIILIYPYAMPPETLRELTYRGYIAQRVWAGWVDWGKGDVLVFRRTGRALRR
ncbi:MAG: hypothetical protein O2800_04930 [Planctomycetota bacterium]|nr:hypothetical protein [Planctomycetota bacterium]